MYFVIDYKVFEIFVNVFGGMEFDLEVIEQYMLKDMCNNILGKVSCEEVIVLEGGIYLLLVDGDYFNVVQKKMKGGSSCNWCRKGFCIYVEEGIVVDQDLQFCNIFEFVNGLKIFLRQNFLKEFGVLFFIDKLKFFLCQNIM